ncbi:phage baseplate assembly protein V [Paraburkholderia sp.]|uniref:phage baseplate assembly protein V n=1 Tax=Paraburkholderia sp. TaxID=1926495 RepID=UPI0025F7C23D|nr:phage baseplate assembly protein V [Paraburkholderia sp.]
MNGIDETFDEFGATIKYGTVSASRPGFARVRLTDLGNLRTMWLPIAYPKTQDDQCCWTYDNGEHVALLLDRRGEDGVILGAIYSDVDRPPVTDPNKFVIRFKDGALLEYDRATHVLRISGMQRVEMEAGVEVVVRAPKALFDVADTRFTGSVTIDGQLAYKGGMSGSGGDGATAVIKGRVRVDGDIEASGKVMDAGGNSNHHRH